MEEKRKLNFLLYGESSFLNKGCEAIVNTTIKRITESCEGDIVLSTNDLNDKNAYSDIITKYVKGYYKEEELSEEEREKLEYYKTIPFDYTNFEKIHQKDCLKEIESADICLSVGGDNYCYGEPNWLYTINKEIKDKHKKNVFWCTSLFEEIESDEMIRDLKNYDLIMVRETLTYKALSKYIDEERLLLVPDPAFALEMSEIELPSIFKENKKVVGINISPLISKYTENENHILDSFKALIDTILNETDDNICLISHVYIEGNNDLDSLKIIKDLYKDEDRIYVLNERIYDCQELKYVISKCDYLIAARTHASIAGYSNMIPTLVIGYSVKSKGIALDLFGEYEDYVIPVDEITPEILIEKFNFIVKNEKKIKETYNQKIPKYKTKAHNLIKMMLERLDKIDKKYITSKTRCTGCMACVNACPNGAIKLVESDEGFIYPEINDEKCTRCNLCKKICPVNKVYSIKYEKPMFYAAINKDNDDRENSSSGGIAALLAKEILKDNGVVYGATLEGTDLKHIRVDAVEDLYKIMGSKYLQSNIQFILRNVKKDLEEERKVLFTGTPCQIEGLKSYLNKEYENLICISIICHGVPSPMVFKKYIEEKERREEDKIETIGFRNKKEGWHKFSMLYTYKDGKKQTQVFEKDKYMEGFLNNYTLREACYNCQMRFEKKNSSDMIIGDFWGIENVFPEMDDDKGISAIVINSKNGERLFQKITEKMEYRETTLEDILRANPCLKAPVAYTKKRQKFFDMIKYNEIATTVTALKSEDFEEKMEKEWKEIKAKDEAIEFFKGQMHFKDKAIEEIKEESQRKEETLKAELEKIYCSRRWKYSSQIAKLINKIRMQKG